MQGEAGKIVRVAALVGTAEQDCNAEAEEGTSIGAGEVAGLTHSFRACSSKKTRTLILSMASVEVAGAVACLHSLPMTARPWELRAFVPSPLAQPMPLVPRYAPK